MTQEKTIYQESVNFDRRKSLEFKAMGESFKLDMTPNNKLMAPYVRLPKTLFLTLSNANFDRQ